MATFETTRPAPFGAVTTFRIVSALDNVRNSISDWNAKRMTRISLNSLSEHELNDIGLCRGDIDTLTAASAGRF